MPLTCTHHGCDAAVTIIESNGATDPTTDRWERYECARGHQFTKMLAGRGV